MLNFSVRSNLLLLCVSFCCIVLHTSAVAQRVFDTTYTPHLYSDGSQNATIRIPANPNHSAVILVHELGTVKETMQLWSDTLSAHGYLTMNIDYPDPVNTSATFPAPPRAFKTAVQFLRSNAAKLGVNETSIFALGRSLGAAVIGEAIIGDNQANLFHDNPAINDSISGAILLYGIYDDAHFLQSNLPLQSFFQKYFKGSPVVEAAGLPVKHATNVHEPLLIITGTDDQTIQQEQSIELFDSVDKYHHGTVFLNQYLLEPHLFETTFDNRSFTSVGRFVVDSALSFLSKIRTASRAVPTGRRIDGDASVLYPNPVVKSDWHSIDLSCNVLHSSIVHVDLYNSAGERCYSQPISVAGKGRQDIRLEIGALRSGAYQLVASYDGAIQTAGLIVLP
jgi:acetyl esterase/lipase